MGYRTDFYGRFDVQPTLTAEHAAYLAAFSESRRMTRKSAVLEEASDPLRLAVGLPVGPEGCYFIGTPCAPNQYSEEGSIVEVNIPPIEQPSLWCHWAPSEDRTSIEWNESDKFHCYVEWLEYLVHHFLKPWGYSVNGEVEWRGDEEWDEGVILVNDNQVRAYGPLVVSDGNGARPLRAFISYAKEDIETAKEISEKLHGMGADVWLDETSILPGQDWRLAIEKGLSEADVVVLCLSRSAVDKRGYVQKEVAIALDLVDMQPEGHLYLVPLRLDGCEVPRRLGKWQWLEYTSDRFEELLCAAMVKRVAELSGEVT